MMQDDYDDDDDEDVAGSPSPVQNDERRDETKHEYDGVVVPVHSYTAL
jgi:hypothetical protein